MQGKDKEKTTTRGKTLGGWVNRWGFGWALCHTHPRPNHKIVPSTQSQTPTKHNRHHKKVTDAVAGSKSSCEFYGRASQAGRPTFVDHAHPQHGVTVTYAGGRYVGLMLGAWYVV